VNPEIGYWFYVNPPPEAGTTAGAEDCDTSDLTKIPSQVQGLN
jgi:hypothetical protein